MTPISEEHFTHTHEGQTFSGQKVHLDGGKFIRCHFERCTVIFEGRRPFWLSLCTQDEVTVFAVDDIALRVLQMLVSNFTPKCIDGLLTDIRIG